MNIEARIWNLFSKFKLKSQTSYFKLQSSQRLAKKKLPMNINTKLKSRPPIVVVLGHVDHGKTTLLDYIRQTSVAKKEKGGITQSIGASVVTTKEGKEITFIDTPGHAAFSNMRSRGANVADVAILVVAADDGVKPQTKEALEHVLSAKLPYIVAATKIDLPTASVESVRTQLEKLGVSFEGRGGDVPLVGVSAKTGKGIEDFLEMITLVSELHGVKENPQAPLEAVVIETAKGKAGPSATVVVRNGRLAVGDKVVSETTNVKVRGLFDHRGYPVKEVNPGEPAQVIGFEELPPIGSRIWHKDEKSQLEVSERREVRQTKVEEGQIPLVIKAQNAGSLEAILTNLPEEVFVISSSVGDVNESDIFMAKSGKASRILAFESKLPTSVSKLAETEGVSVDTFDVIYELFEKVEKLVKEGQIEVLAEAEIKAFFPYNSRRVAGCKVLRGKIFQNDSLILRRDDKELGKVRVESMKRQKQDIKEAKQGEECGILFTPQLDFKVGDMLLSVRKP